jgi:hypothetical protein
MSIKHIEDFRIERWTGRDLHARFDRRIESVILYIVIEEYLALSRILDLLESYRK